MRKDFYVYFHRDQAGRVFYIGKGTVRRAWSKERHPVWTKYVAERVNGTYSVEIYRDGLTEFEAEDLESSLIAEHGQQLVNWVNPRRNFDHQALDRYHKLRDENRRFISETRPLEQSDPLLAIARYQQALAAMREYESITIERGLVAELGAKPDWGDLNILDRLTLCLIKLGRFEEASREAAGYFRDFPSSLHLSVGRPSSLE